MKTLLPLILLWAGAVSAAEVLTFDSAAQEQSFHRLVAELRCTVCQNQNIADSNADLAKDLRAKVYAMLREGKSEREILDFMVERYGNFVLYSPPKEGASLLIWVLPFFVLAGGGLLLMRVLRAQRATAGSRDATAAADADSERLARARELLAPDEDRGPR